MEEIHWDISPDLGWWNSILNVKLSDRVPGPSHSIGAAGTLAPPPLWVTLC